MAHNPEVAGSNPAPATKVRRPDLNKDPTFCLLPAPSDFRLPRRCAAGGWSQDQARVSVGWLAEDVGLVSKVGDDLQLAAESLNVGGQSLHLALLQLPFLDS